jgi:hypothetical protein
MPNPSNNPEMTAIEAAYATQVQVLFKGLITNLGDEPVTHQTDQHSVNEFTAGLNTAKRAKQLALNVVAASPASTAASRGKKVKGK